MSRPPTLADPVAGLCGQARSLHQQGRLAEAVALFDRALALAPNHADALYDRAVALLDLSRLEEALAGFCRVVELSPGLALARYACGMANADLGRDEAAVQWFSSAIAIDPRYADAHVLRAFSWLRMGRFDLGWRAYEWRRARWPDALPRLDPQAAWRGQPDLAGKTVFLHHEQGLGDSIQFVRYARELSARGARPILSVQDTLRPLFETLDPILELIGEADRPDRYDYHCSLLSLPLGFSTTLETIPSPGPYLFADAARRGAIEALLGPARRPRVGLAWSGHPNHPNDARRSMPFAALAPLLALDVQWIALQNELRPSDAAAFAADGRVAAHPRARGDFADTAALVDLMDVVVTVDTSLAHLAGALGKPVYVLLPFAAEWRWMLNRADSPWYPSARLVRQPRPGDWASAVESLARDLPAALAGAGA